MKFGIISLGNHAMNRVMPAIKSSGNEISAIYSRNMEKAEKESMKYGSKPYDNLDRFFSDSEFEAVYISSPNFMHFQHAERSINEGKNVLVEKQMTLKNVEAEKLVDLVAKKNLHIAVGFHMRFNPAVDDIKKMISNGELGEIAHIHGTWAHLSTGSRMDPDSRWWSEDDKVGGGSVMGTGVHVIDTINYILGRKPDSVYGIKRPEGRLIEDTETIIMRYRDTVGEALSSRSIAGAFNSLVIQGSKTTLVAENIFGTSVACSLKKGGKIIKEYGDGNVYQKEVSSFVDLVSGRKSTIAQVKDGEIVVKIVNAANESDATKQEVRL
ncbi:Gfo/Idh/MocA family oxidoreductase [Oxyplasma meridianum]|uniref:Gfo/Idh/MocA family oxidoreductase n=1 Tax=Oxyplasma meridianum TaxID=3073602 RepID=A0AAX4NFL5_9ARCH